MREFLYPVNAAQIQTALGPIYVVPGGRMGIQVHAPHLSVDAVPLQASADLSSNGEPSRFDPVQTRDSKEGRFFTGHNALRARVVDGRDADLVTLGKIAQVIVPAVPKFAQENQGLLLEAERCGIRNELATLEREIENKRAKLEERQRELAAVTEALSHTYDRK
jgi:hypothetical protein